MGSLLGADFVGEASSLDNRGKMPLPQNKVKNFTGRPQAMGF
jgi:hypothetical protein